MKLLQLFFVIFIAATDARIPEEQNQNGLVQVESITLAEPVVTVKPKIEINPCFHADVDTMCFNKTGSATKSNCECEQHPENPIAIVCCNVTDINRAISCVGNTSSYSHFHIINAHQNEINVSQINSVKQFDSLFITDGNVTKITGAFSKFSMIKCLNFSNNNITEINERALLGLVQLQILDLSANNLTKLPTPPTPTHAKIDVRGNERISCINVSSAIEKGTEFLYEDVSFCEVATIYHWFNSTARISIQELKNMKKVQVDCPENCKCVPDRMFYSAVGAENSLMYFAKVDCSSLGLTRLPEKLPENTLSLNISNNSISSLSELAREDSYKNIRLLFADDNLITSFVELEGSTFLENFMKLSLKNNKIKHIPFYILSNALERNLNGKLVYLGGNRIHCECQTVKNQRIWRLVQDCEALLCDNMQAKVLELKESQLCKSGYHDWASYIDYVIVIEVILLVALFTKVFYDWYIFKNSGFLPAPASWIILYNHRK